MPATDYLAPDEFADLLDTPEFKTLRPAQRAAVFDAGLKDSEAWLRENNALDAQTWQQTAMALGSRYRPAEADIELDQQGPLGTAVNAFKNLGPDVVQGVVGGVAKMADAASEMVGLSDPNVPSWMDQTADFTEELQQQGRIIRPLNPANPTAATIGSGAGQAVALLGTAGASLPVLGARAMTAVPAAMGFAMGAGSGIDTAEAMGITSPAARLGMGTAFGAIEGATEMIGGIGGRFIPTPKGLPGMALAPLMEGGEEMLSQAAQDATTAGVGQFMADPNRPGFTQSGYELPAFNAAMLERQKQAAIGGAAGGAVFAGVQALSPSTINPEPSTNDGLPPNQTPAPSGAPQTPGATPGAAPLAGAAGPLPSTLSRIAQESLVPDLPEDTGELTADEVQDLEGAGEVPGSSFLVPGSSQAPSTTNQAPLPSPLPTAANPNPAQTFTGSNVQMGTEMPVPSPTAPAGAGTGAMGRVISTGKPNGAQVSAVIDYVEAADLEPLLLREVGSDQTRDRANNRGSSEQVASIATMPDAQLLGDSPVSSMGAPVVDDVILAGNGRAEGLLQGYRGGGAGIANYRAQIVQQAAAQGRPDVAAMKQPVMIRRVTGYVRGDRRSFVTESNPKYSTLQETVAEAALLDAEVLGDMSGIEFTQSGQLTSSSLQQVATKLKEAQRGVNATTGGKPDAVEGTRRVQLASLAKLAKDNGVDVAELSGLLETDVGRRAVAEVSKAAPRLAALDADLGLGDVMLSALRSFSEGARAVSQGIFKNLTEWADNRGQELIRDELSPEAGQILEIMIETVRTPTKLRELFDTYLEVATNEQNQRNQAAGSNDIFGDARNNVPGKQILRRQMAGANDTASETAQTSSGQGDESVAGAAALDSLLSGTESTPPLNVGGFKNLNVSGRTAGFLNTDILNEATDLLRSGITDFANWSRAMVSRFGRAIQEFLAGIWQQVTSPQTNAAQNVRMGRAQGTAPVTLGNSGAALDASKFQLISAGTGQDSAAGLFQYENRNEASLNQGEREALDALRREYPGESITPVSIRDVRRSPDGATRGSSRDSALEDWSRSFLKVFGKNILWIDAVGKNSQYLNGGNPTTQRNILVVNANSREPILYTLGHELTHALKAQNSTIYRELEREILANGTNLEAYRERLRNAGYAEEQINDELIADFVGSQMLEPDFLNRLADAKPTLFARFARAVVRFLNQLLTKVSKLQRDVRPYFEAKIIPLRDTLAAALKEYAASGQFPDNPLSEPKPGVQMSQALNPFTPSDAPGWMRTLFKMPSVGAFRVQNLSVRKLLTGSALPTAMADIVTAAERDKKSIEYAASTLANDLEQAMQAHSAATGQTQQQVNDLVSNVLQGALPLTIVLNPELRTAIRRARNLLDSLSTAVAGATSGQMGSTILANLGTWMRRSYAAFDPAAGWSFDELTKAAAKGRKVAGEPAAKILNDARRYLRSQTPGLTLGELEAQMRQLMDRNLWEEALIGSGAGVRKDVSSLMKRKDIAPEIRALMGEERNPVKKLIGSAKWQAQFVAKHENQQKIRDVGLQLGMFSPSQTGRFTEELGEDRSTSGFALNGKKIYTTPELRRALSQTTGVLATDDLGSNFLKMIYWLGGQAKLNKVALNPDSWVVNLLGNFTGLAMTGGLSPFAPLRLYQNSRKAIELLRSGKKQAAAGTQQQVQNDLMRQMMAKLTAAGVADSSMNAQLVEDALNKNLIQFIERHDVWNGAVGAVKLAVVGQALAKPFGAAGRAVGGVVGGVAGYTIGNERVQNVQEAIAKWTMQNPDRFGKIVEFLDNQTTLMAAGMTPDAAFAKATQKTLNTMPDYSKLPAVLRQFSRLGVVGSFIAFQWEVYRNSFHNLKYIAEELGSGNPALMEKGARRLLGMGAVYALALGGLQAILGGAAGDDEKDEAYRRALAKPWEKYSRLAYTQLDTEKASFYNTSYLLPQVTLTEILRAASEGKDFAQALEQAGGVLQKQFAETGIHADPLLALLFNFDKGGQKATTEEGWRATLERLGEILAPMTPGAADKFERLLRSKEVLNAPRWDREFSVAEEMKRLLGIRQATYAHDRRIAGRLSEFNSRKRDITTTAAQVFGEAGKARADVWGRQAQQQAADRATERLNALKAEYDQFVQDLGTLGFKPTQIERFRKDAGTSPNWKPYGITPEGIKQP